MPLPTGADHPAAPPAGTLEAWAACTREMALLLDARCRVAWCSPALERLLAGAGAAGTDAADLLALAEPHRAAWRAALERLARDDEAFGELDVELAGADGASVWLRIAAHRVDATAAGSGAHWLCVATDVSSAKRVESEVAKLREFLSLGQSFGRLGAWERDLRTGAGRWDAQVFRLYGFDPADGVPTVESALTRIHPQDREQFGNGPGNPGAQPGRHDRRYRLVHPDGSVRWVHSQWEIKAGPDGGAERAIGILLDDTEAARLVQALGSASAQLELAISLGNIAIWRHDIASGQITFNDRAHEVFGLPEGTDRMSLADFRARVHREDLARVVAASGSALASEQATDIEGRFKGIDGIWRTLLTRRVVERASDGAPVAFVGIALDVTRQADERRQANRMLHHMEAAAAAARVGIWSKDVQSGRSQWNDSMFALVGRPVASEAPSREVWHGEIVHPADLPRLLATCSAFRAAPRGFSELTYRVRLPDGETRWLEDRVRREMLDGRATLFGVTLDVTERKRVEEALRSVDERAALATRSAGIGTWEMSLVDAEERWDAQMFRLRGIAVREKPPPREERLAMVHPDDRHLVFDTHADAKTNTSAAKYEFRVRWPDGSERWIASRSIAVQDDGGRPIRRVGVNWDVTETKLAEAARQEIVLAQRESLAKSQLLSRVSHELRTPLNAVLGFAQLLLSDSSITDAQRKRLVLIRSAGEHLLVLINDMLDLTALDTGEIKLDPQPVALAALVRETLQLVEPLASQHRVALHAGGADGVALADPTRLRQVLINLLTNAVKYNRPGGSVAVDVHAAGSKLEIGVSDTGRGLAPHQLAHLFEPFNRLGAEGDGIEGSGIGLVIVKALVERMNGEVAVESEPALGTRFRVTLPAAQAPAADARGARAEAAPAPAIAPTPRADAPARPPAASRGRVLYIEDNAVNVLLVREIVAQRPGIEMLVAADGEQGVALALAHRPELVLVDMQLPDFDGFEVLRRLRSAPGGRALRCIALSANAMPEDIARAREAGFADYWTKPIDFKGFLAGLDATFAARHDAG